VYFTVYTSKVNISKSVELMYDLYFMIICEKVRQQF